MPKALEEITRDAMDLPPRQKLALAGFLLESADAAGDSKVELAWENELGDRVRAIDDGAEKGILYKDVMREAEKQLRS